MATNYVNIPTNPVIQGSTATMAATSGVPGQLFFNTSYNAMFTWVKDRWWAVGSPDPRYGFYIEDEFNSAVVGSQLSWLGLGGLNISASGVDPHPGVFLIDNTTASSTSSLILEYLGLSIGTSDIYYDAWVAIPTLATVGEDFVASVGIGNSVAYDVNGAAPNSIFFSLNRADNGINWNCITSASSVTTKVKTSTPVIAGTFYHLSFVLSMSAVKFYVNSTLVATISTNIPTSGTIGPLFKVDKTAGTALSELKVDRMNMHWFFGTPR